MTSRKHSSPSKRVSATRRKPAVDPLIVKSIVNGMLAMSSDLWDAQLSTAHRRVLIDDLVREVTKKMSYTDPRPDNEMCFFKELEAMEAKDAEEEKSKKNALHVKWTYQMRLRDNTAVEEVTMVRRYRDHASYKPNNWEFMAAQKRSFLSAYVDRLEGTKTDVDDMDEGKHEVIERDEVERAGYHVFD